MRIRLNHQRLLELISAGKISQNHWAIRLGLSRGHWSNIVRGRHPYPSGKTRERLLEAFAVDFAELFHYETAGGADAAFQAEVADRYLLDEEIGQGGMGTVFKARDVRLGRTVAIKVVSEEAVSGIGIAQFLKEIRYTARLQHPNILPLYDAGEAAGFPYYVMPLVHGGSLRDLLRGGPLSLDRTLRTVGGVAEALGHAHENQVLHCDIKPENVLLHGRHVYVADFGISRVIHAEVFEWGTRNGLDSSAGTPAYVSPEQASGQRALDARSDVYSLGCMVFELLSGRPPFAGTTTTEVVAKRFVEVPELSRVAPHVPPAVATIVRRAMSVDEADRPASAETFADQLRDAGDDRASVMRRIWGASLSATPRAWRRGRPAPRKRRHIRMDSIRQDLRYAVRTLRRAPGTAMLAVLTLALGIGATTAIFSVVNGILLEPLPFPASDRVMVMSEVDERGRTLQVSPPNFFDWRERTRTFSDMSFSMFDGWQTVLGGVAPVRARVERVGRDFLRVFQMQPILGRDFSAEENSPGGDPTVLVAHRFWRDQLGADSNLTALALAVDGTTFQVIGVLPPGFRFQGDSDVWIPAERESMTTSRTTYALRVIGRLRAGVTLGDAVRDMRDVASQIRAEDARSTAVEVGMESLQERIVGSTRRPLLLLFGAAGLLLLIACTNVASTLLARGAGRRRELVMRAALGASRGRIVRQLVTESAVLGAAGAVTGLLLAFAGLRVLVSYGSTTLSRLDNVSIDPAVLGFAGVAAVCTIFVFGLWPALHAGRTDAALVLRSGTTTGPHGHARAWSSLVGAEVALAVMLLVGAGLLIRSFWNLLETDPGFDPGGVLTVEYSLPATTYPYESIAAFHQRMLATARRIPGVDRVGVVNHLPLSGQSMFAGVRSRESDEWHRGDYRLAGGDYFAALGTPIVRGRGFAEQDGPNAPHVTVINEALADELWPGEDPLGRQIVLSGNDRHAETPLHVIGVAANVHHGELATAEPPTYYVHYLQRPTQSRTVVAAFRTNGDPAELTAAVRHEFAAMDPEVPLQFATMASRVSRSVADRRFTMMTLGSFAGLALLLASVGIFGVVSYSVARRQRELGIRLALGAAPERILRMVIRESMTTVLVGVAIGVAGSVVATGVLRGLLHEVNPIDPGTIAAVVVTLGTVAFTASYLPARRATAADPRMIVRSE